MTLKEMRERVGYTQTLVAKKLNICDNAVSQWERGQNGMATKYISKLAKMYRVTEDDIIAAVRLAREGK